MIEWGKILETFIAAGAGALTVVLIDWMVKYCIYKKKNFQEAISIQLALHQILAVSLKIRQFYNQKEKHFLNLYSQIKVANAPAEAWLNFRHIDLPPYLHTFDISLDWDFTQFLSRRENKTRNTLNHLIPTKLSYQSLMFIIKERNELLWPTLQEINQVRNTNGVVNNFEYVNDNLEKIIGLPRDKRLQDVTHEYVKTVDSTIISCNEAFDILSRYINKNFFWSTPLALNIPNDIKKVLTEVVSSNDKKSK